MQLKQTRLVTTDVVRLTRFYERIAAAQRKPGGHNYVELDATCAGLAIVGPNAVSAYGSEVVSPAANRSVILDFEVEDVDAEYERLLSLVNFWVSVPKTQPWGNRAMLFRDPDGNLINVFAPRAA